MPFQCEIYTKINSANNSLDSINSDTRRRFLSNSDELKTQIRIIVLYPFLSSKCFHPVIYCV